MKVTWREWNDQNVSFVLKCTLTVLKISQKVLNGTKSSESFNEIHNV